MKLFIFSAPLLKIKIYQTMHNKPVKRTEVVFRTQDTVSVWKRWFPEIKLYFPCMHTCSLFKSWWYVNVATVILTASIFNPLQLKPKSRNIWNTFAFYRCRYCTFTKMLSQYTTVLWIQVLVHVVGHFTASILFYNWRIV